MEEFLLLLSQWAGTDLDLNRAHLSSRQPSVYIFLRCQPNVNQIPHTTMNLCIQNGPTPQEHSLRQHTKSQSPKVTIYQQVYHLRTTFTKAKFKTSSLSSMLLQHIIQAQHHSNLPQLQKLAARNPHEKQAVAKTLLTLYFKTNPLPMSATPHVKPIWKRLTPLFSHKVFHKRQIRPAPFISSR